MLSFRFRPVTSYEEICSGLERDFVSRGQSEAHIRLVGILFARPTSTLAKDEVIPNLPYFHKRSGDHVNFYCGGYWEGQLHPDDDGRIQISNGWMYSDAKFDEFRKDIESRSKWKYSGGVDLILTNARFDPKPYWAKVRLDFSSAISATLDAMSKDGAIQSVEWFFEQIFRYAENQSGTDPTWGFSDKAGVQIAGSALKKLLLSLLPTWASDDAKKAFHFTVSDVSK